MVLNIYTEGEVSFHGLQKVGYDQAKQAKVKEPTRLRRFKKHFGASPKVVGLVWEELQTTDNALAKLAPDENTQKHFDLFLMCFFYLKTYPIEETLASRFQIHEQTARKWIRHFVNKIAELHNEKVVWPDDNEWDTTFIISIDCVNFGTNEPRHPTLHKQKKYFDRKGGKAGLTYEVALHLWENRVVWFNGPFPPNDGGDAAIFKEKGLQDKIPAGRKAIADKIYKGIAKIALHNSLDTPAVREFKGRARARQESIMSRLKSFGVLKQRFRHGIAKHEKIARAVMVICVFQMENGSPLFSV
mgnify:CR=1 FL=1